VRYHHHHNYRAALRGALNCNCPRLWHFAPTLRSAWARNAKDGGGVGSRAANSEHYGLGRRIRAAVSRPSPPPLGRTGGSALTPLSDNLKAVGCSAPLLLGGALRRLTATSNVVSLYRRLATAPRAVAPPIVLGYRGRIPPQLL
jgi:hypothetical protein